MELDNKTREKITLAMSECYTQEGSACPLHSVFQPQKAINLIEIILKAAGYIQLKEVVEWIRKHGYISLDNPDEWKPFLKEHGMEVEK